MIRSRSFGGIVRCSCAFISFRNVYRRLDGHILLSDFVLAVPYSYTCRDRLVLLFFEQIVGVFEQMSIFQALQSSFPVLLEAVIVHGLRLHAVVWKCECYRDRGQSLERIYLYSSP